jgi:hypothetical protein
MMKNLFFIVALFLLPCFQAQAITFENLEGYWIEEEAQARVMLIREPFIWDGTDFRMSFYRFKILRQSKRDVLIALQEVSYNTPFYTDYMIDPGGRTPVQGASIYARFSFDKNGLQMESCPYVSFSGLGEFEKLTVNELLKYYNRSSCEQEEDWVVHNHGFKRPMDKETFPVTFLFLAPDLLPWAPHKRETVQIKPEIIEDVAPECTQKKQMN